MKQVDINTCYCHSFPSLPKSGKEREHATSSFRAYSQSTHGMRKRFIIRRACTLIYFNGLLAKYFYGCVERRNENHRLQQYCCGSILAVGGQTQLTKLKGVLTTATCPVESQGSGATPSQELFSPRVMMSEYEEIGIGALLDAMLQSYILPPAFLRCCAQPHS